MGGWRNAVGTVGFVPKFCAKWYGREIHCSHGDHFRAKFQFLCRRHFLPTWRKLQKRTKNKHMTFQNKGFGEMPSSRLDSHRNSVQNCMVESFWALTATVFVPNLSFYVTATFCPLDGNCKNEQKTKKLREVGQASQIGPDLSPPP